MELSVKTSKSKILAGALFFVLGFSSVFIIFFYVFNNIAQLILDNIIVRSILGLTVIAFGVHIAGWIKLPFLSGQMQIRIGRKKQNTTIIGSFLIGMAFAIGWSPCTGPILAGIIAFTSATTGDWIKGFIMIILYAAGLGIPFILTAVFINSFSSFIQKAKKAMQIIEIASGVLLILMGVLIILSRMDVLYEYIGGMLNHVNFNISGIEENLSTITQSTNNFSGTSGLVEFGNGSISSGNGFGGSIDALPQTSLLSYILAFLAGGLSFLSPCILPIIPGYISLITGLSAAELRDTMSNKK